jgi:YbbR domain-containing protein
MKCKKLQFGKLFYNDKFVLIFSIFASLVLWFVLASTNTEEHPRVISNVPITITLSDSAQQDGLKVFSPVNSVAKVSIKGNSMIVNQIQASDLELTALASTITAPGDYSVPLQVNKTGTLKDFDVDSITPSQIVVSVDRYKEKTFQIDANIEYKEGYTSDTAYFVGLPTLSSDTVTISGPEKEVSQINKAAIEYQVTDTLRESKSFTSDVILYDANGNKLNIGKMKLSVSKVDVTIPVLPRKVLPLSIDFTNKPSGLNLTSSQITIDPVNIEVAGPKESIESLKEISLTSIDFSDVSPTKNTFKINITLPNGCKNLSSIPTAQVTLNLDGMSTRSMVVKNFSVKNLASDKTAKVNTKSLTVTVVGPESEISKLTEGSLSAQIDMTGKENFTGNTEMPATIGISGTSSSWVYGSYMTNISVSSK